MADELDGLRLRFDAALNALIVARLKLKSGSAVDVHHAKQTIASALEALGVADAPK